jgi:hypothetical protein
MLIFALKQPVVGVLLSWRANDFVKLKEGEKVEGA